MGAFRLVDNAAALRARLAERFANVVIVPTHREGVTYYRARLGGFASDAELEAAAKALRAAGFAPLLARD